MQTKHKSLKNIYRSTLYLIIFYIPVYIISGRNKLYYKCQNKYFLLGKGEKLWKLNFIFVIIVKMLL